MRNVHFSIIEQISKALHAQYDAVAKQPLPERWVDLIIYLKEKERTQGLSPPGDGAASELATLKLESPLVFSNPVVAW